MCSHVKYLWLSCPVNSRDRRENVSVYVWWWGEGRERGRREGGGRDAFTMQQREKEMVLSCPVQGHTRVGGLWEPSVLIVFKKSVLLFLNSLLTTTPYSLHSGENIKPQAFIYIQDIIVLINKVSWGSCCWPHLKDEEPKIQKTQTTYPGSFS